MPTDEELGKWRRALRATFPVIGTFRRRGAVKKLAQSRNEAKAVPLLIEAFGSGDRKAAERAGAALRDLDNGDAVDALCDEVVRNPSGPLAQLWLERGYRPTEDEEFSLALFVTRQLDTYFKEFGEDEFQHLRMAYDRGDQRIKANVMDVVRSGDRRCLGFFGRRKPLRECTAEEIRLAIESWLRHKDWPRLFQAFKDLPMSYGFPLLAYFRESGWEPRDPDDKSLYAQVLAHGQGASAPAASPESDSLFEEWLASGRSGEMAKLAASGLVEKLKTATPPEAVAVVGALAGKAQRGSPEAEAVMSSPHWLTRLAGHAVGFGPGLGEAEAVQIDDPNHWVKEFASAANVLATWPAAATPPDLDAMNAWAPEMLTGALGAVRKTLRALVGSRMTVGEFDELVVELDEFAGTYEMADDVEIESGQ